MPPIIIDIKEVASEFFMGEEEIRAMSRYILAKVSDGFVREWEHLIDQNLHSTRNEYKKGIFSDQVDDYNIIIGLTPRQSSLAMMLVGCEVGVDKTEGSLVEK